MSQIAYTVPEAAAAIGYRSTEVIRQLIAKKKIKAVRLTADGELRIPHDSLNDYVNNLVPINPEKENRR